MNVVCQTKQKALEHLKSTSSYRRGQFMCMLYLKNDQANLNNNPKWSNQVRKSKHAEHIIHVFLVLS